MTHVFIVNEQTFKVHLEYMFAGTGYGTNIPDFIDETKKTTKSDNTEKTFASMIADISRVRMGNLVAFYVTGCKKIFGFFKVASEPFFNQNSTDYLGDSHNLNRYLPFRVKIEPYLVFSEGITEHQALDDIYNIEHPYEMCWSLIYRKLTGMRGCSCITDFEHIKLNVLISAQNKGIHLKGNNYSYDKESQKIISINETHTYVGKTNINLDIEFRLLQVTNSFETHLQAYITQNHDKGQLKELLYPKDYLKSWLGNEVVCSVGEQRIDVLLLAETKEKYYIRIIELKDERPSKYILEEQIRWYIQWVGQYIIPLLNKDKEINIIPTIIADSFLRNTKRKKEFDEACDKFKSTKAGSFFETTICPVEYISFERTNKEIIFKRIF